MSQMDFEAARNRLEQAIQKEFWVLAVLNDPGPNLEHYSLTRGQVDELFQEFHLAEIQTDLAQVLLRSVNIKVKSKNVKIIGPASLRLMRQFESITHLPSWEDRLDWVYIAITPEVYDVPPTKHRTNRPTGVGGNMPGEAYDIPPTKHRTNRPTDDGGDTGEVYDIPPKK